MIKHKKKELNMTAKELQTQLKQTLESIVDHREKLSAQISHYDLQIQDLLHYMEIEPCDAVDLVRIAVQLKNIQQQRRVCKIECDKLRSVYDSFQGKNVTKLLDQDLTKFEKKTYTDKTTVINDMILSHKNNRTK
jgi:hypothetical protein